MQLQTNELPRHHHERAREARQKTLHQKMRITVYDVLDWLTVGTTHAEILDDFPELTETDVRACLEFGADRNRCLIAQG